MKDLTLRVYAYLLTVPQGKVVTYSQIAKQLGNNKLSRVVGNILHNNPDGNKIPCYKVVNKRGELSTQYAFGGINEQKRRLEKDGIKVENYKVDLSIYQYVKK